MLAIAQKVWLVIKIDSCYLLRAKGLSALQRLFVFVCGGNTSRSPMAQAICNDLIAKRLKVPLESLADLGVQALSAGISARPGTPIIKEAQDALRQIDISSFQCTARSLDAEMVDRAEAIFCMTAEQCKKVTASFPHAAPKVQRLWVDRDIDDPHGKDQAAFCDLAALLRNLIHKRLDDLEPIAGEVEPAQVF
jgi:protein-tyrosine phosphatase